MKKRVVVNVFPLLTLLLNTSFADKYVAEFLEVGASAVIEGVGGSCSSADTDISAIFWNPSVVSGSLSDQIYLMHASLFDNLYRLEAASYRMVLCGWGWGAGFLNMATGSMLVGGTFFDYGSDGIPGTSDVGEANGVWDPGEPYGGGSVPGSENDYALWVAGGMNMSTNFVLGGALKILYQGISSHRAFGLGLDIGIRYRESNWGLVFSANDVIGTRLFWSTGLRENKLPSIRLGGYYVVDISALQSLVRLCGESECRFEGKTEDALASIPPMTLSPHAGIVWTIAEKLHIRAGLNGKYFTAGVGIEILQFRIDYAYSMTESEPSHRVGLAFTFKPSKPRLPPDVQMP